MTIVTIYFNNPANPIEVQKWLDANTTSNVVAGWTFENYIYLITNP